MLSFAEIQSAIVSASTANTAMASAIELIETVAVAAIEDGQLVGTFFVTVDSSTTPPTAGLYQLVSQPAPSPLLSTVVSPGQSALFITIPFVQVNS